MESVKMKKATKTVAFRQLAIYCNIVDNQLLTDAKYFFNAYLCSCKCLIYNILQSFTEGRKFVRGDKLGTAFLQRN